MGIRWTRACDNVRLKLRIVFLFPFHSQKRSLNVFFFFIIAQALKQMMLQLDHERNLKLDAFERVEDLQRQVKLITPTIKILS